MLSKSNVCFDLDFIAKKNAFLQTGILKYGLKSKLRKSIFFFFGGGGGFSMIE